MSATASLILLFSGAVLSALPFIVGHILGIKRDQRNREIDLRNEHTS